ncbi:Transcriptional activator acu-15 [Fusarium albosuccineum]|uniref:Transcriptional activator acu-15 n=1 Tax=Fusarium albosuccineum TaxID=1237068 RepID=A0A8H4P5Z7_9HYPO|nr:Transcriptional activator acu-15 [Fusarium albosuccineum]
MVLQQTAQSLPLSVMPNTTDSNTVAANQLNTIKSAGEPVIGHMGRLVADDRQASMFGGSTTGVHFISQAEQQLQLLQMHKDAFPSCAYGLYLHSPWGASTQNSVAPIISDIAMQLPHNTVDIVEATINQWTPLYPIVHKPSTLDSVGKLLGGYEVTSSDIAVLYQMLGLVALGTIGQAGDCIQQHHHFLCLSQRFYLISTALFDRASWRSSQDCTSTSRAHMWERVVLEPEIDPELATPPANMSLESMFLRVAHCVATIHVHRPALSFTTADAQFVSSLKACGHASASLVRLLSSGLAILGADQAMSHATEYPASEWPESLLVTLLYPNGIHMLWQAGLTILFAGWKGYPVTVDQDESLIQSCIETLRQLHAHTDDVGNHVGQCADVLELLRKKIFSDLQAPPDLEQLQWNVWDWPMASALELANTLDTAPLDLDLDPERWL